MRVALTRADSASRWRDLGIVGLGVPWLIYTALYFVLQPRGLTASPSAFMWLTGRPDPACGLTRTFAWIWRGDLPQAVHVYPLGPLVFLLTVGAIAYALIALPLRRSLQVQLTPWARRLAFTAVGLAIAANWAAKLLWLGM